MTKKCVHSRAYHRTYTAAVRDGLDLIAAKAAARAAAKQAADAFMES